MTVLGGFVPSQCAKRFEYDNEGRLIEFNISRQATGGIGDTNSSYASNAEHFGAIAPFMRLNIQKDRPRRNYMVQAGGAILYNDPDFGRAT